MVTTINGVTHTSREAFVSTVDNPNGVRARELYTQFINANQKRAHMVLRPLAQQRIVQAQALFTLLLSDVGKGRAALDLLRQELTAQESIYLLRGN